MQGFAGDCNLVEYMTNDARVHDRGGCGLGSKWISHIIIAFDKAFEEKQSLSTTNLNDNDDAAGFFFLG